MCPNYDFSRETMSRNSPCNSPYSNETGPKKTISRACGAGLLPSWSTMPKDTIFRVREETKMEENDEENKDKEEKATNRDMVNTKTLLMVGRTRTFLLIEVDALSLLGFSTRHGNTKNKGRNHQTSLHFNFSLFYFFRQLVIFLPFSSLHLPSCILPWNLLHCNFCFFLWRSCCSSLFLLIIDRN